MTVPLVETLSLVKEYASGGGTVHAIAGVSLAIARGEFVAIMGASGSGKSTFMNMIGCLDIPSSGDVKIDGTATSAMDSDALAELRNRKIGFVFQQFICCPHHALDKSRCRSSTRGVGRAERLEAARAKLEAMGLGGSARSLAGEAVRRPAAAVAIASGAGHRAADAARRRADRRARQPDVRRHHAPVQTLTRRATPRAGELSGEIADHASRRIMFATARSSRMAGGEPQAGQAVTSGFESGEPRGFNLGIALTAFE